MPLVRRLLAGLFLLVCLPGAAALPAEVESALRAAGLSPDSVGLSVRRLSDNALVMEHNADVAMPPGSTMKVLTSIVGLEVLGPAYRGRTELRARGALKDGVFQGNFYLRGMADVDFDWHAFERMLQRARLQGIRELRGDFVLDRAYFSPGRSDVGLPPFDEAPEFRYNVIPDAIMLNSNLVALDIGSDDTSVQVVSSPPLHRVTFESEMKLVDRACGDWEDGWIIPGVSEERHGVIRVRLRGEYPRNCVASTAINVIDRAVYADRLFRALWTRLGGRFRGTVRDGETPPEARLLAQHQSRTLVDVARDINKRSDNPIARMVYLALGAQSLPAPETTFERADREVRTWLERRGIDPVGIVIENGSGLSRLERIRPSQMVGILRAAWTSEWAPEFLSSLPIAGVDGTMRRRPTEGAYLGSVRVKTGTLRDVSAVAGYVRNADGEQLAVAAVIHGPKASPKVARPLLDLVLREVWRAKAPAAGST